MRDGSGARLGTIGRGTVAKAAAALGVLVILAAIIGPAAHLSRTAARLGSNSTTGAPPSNAPGGDPEAWADLAIAPFVPAAELVADDQDRAGVATGTSFTLRSLTATPAVELARGLHMDPPIEMTAVAGPTADVALVHPVTPLVAGLRYRVRLEAPDGALAGTWAFVARSPLHVAATIPGDRTAEVPTNTGIEVTFDQDGASGIAEHFAIKPTVAGRFETHGRTWAFIPTKPLEAGVIYTVTVGKGIAIEGSSETLGSDVSFRFETAVAANAAAPTIRFGRTIVEARPDVAPVLAVERDSEPENGDAATTAGIVVHRLPDFNAVLAAAAALAGPDAWAVASRSAVVATTGLSKVAAIDAQVVSTEAGWIMRMPLRLSSGFYVVTIQQPGAPQQLLLQVTDLSAYAMTTARTTVLWVNDLARDAPVGGAVVSIAGGRKLGTTDANGLVRIVTPAELAMGAAPSVEDALPAHAAHFLAIAASGGRRLVVPLGLPVPWAYHEPASGSASDQDSNAWWLLFRSDRNAYRQTDTIHMYGTIRARSDRSVPRGVELRLRPADGPPEAPILRVPVTPTTNGVFSGDVRLDDLPMAAYNVDLFVGNTRVSSVWISVTEISKPAYELAVTTDRHVYLLGDPVQVKVTTAFFDGTRIPGIDLVMSGLEQHASATTDLTGEAQATMRAASSEIGGGLTESAIDVAPVHPEEGQITKGTSVVILSSRVWLQSHASVTGGRIVVTGKLTWADIAGLEAARAAGDSLDDPAGAAIAGRAMDVHLVHLIPVRRQTGTTYDFIEKRVVPVYEYTETSASLGTYPLTSAADGTFKLSVAAPVPGDEYQVTLSAGDPEGRHTTLSISASSEAAPVDNQGPAYLEKPIGCGGDAEVVAGLNTPARLTMRTGNGSVATGGRFLFLVGAHGSLETTIQDAATFSRTLRDADLPGFSVRAVWLSPDGYAVSDAVAAVNPADKTITIHLRPDRAAYGPGDHVTIAVTTTDRAGRPIAADVVVHGVDEKLYTLGLAVDGNPVEELMAGVPREFLEAYRSHAVPGPGGDGCGGTGGEGRDDFRDTVTFQRIRTDATGQGSVAFDLSDDLTSWRMSALAISGRLDAGLATVRIPVGLPFFVDAVLAPEYLVGDQPILRLRGYGAGLTTGDPVRFIVSAPSLGLAPTTVEGNAFQALRLSLPTIVSGDHAIRIEASATHAGTTLRDVVIRSIHALDSRLGTLMASYDQLGTGYTPKGGGDGLTSYVVTDAGRARLIPILRDLAGQSSARFDRTASAELARRLLIDQFEVPDGSLPTTGWDAARYQRYGVALLPYASTDLFLTARAAVVAGSLLNADELRGYFNLSFDGDVVRTREEQIVSLVGLASIGEDVLERLHAQKRADLTVREQLWLAIGFAAAGDEAAARSIERSVLESSGQQLGPWVRLAVGTSLDDSLEASGLLLLLAGRLGDPIGEGVSRYLVDHPSNEHVFPLEQLAYVGGMLERLPRAAGRFAWTVDGERHEVALEPGGAFSLVLTKGQRSSLALERLEGDLAVATSWIAPGAGLPSDSLVTVTRTVTPADTAPDDQLVKVTLAMTFGAQAPGGCYRLTDLLPSGLAPVVVGAGWPVDEEENPTLVIGPYEIQGQRVSWCVDTSDRGRVYGYWARVVTPGTYRWEPAVVQSEVAPSVGSSTPGTTYVIR